ncbi:hypothetical protein DPMN_168054 [Dreissena polymorpha]|uniref:Uncharacterized protein n=1 Tax=Dreissena polymorpha TaxID=45954 RepID=A0A9D4EZY6_DREPO|nr:hypothetical protein DPMN_168054 [Dreissena polymorpha]
MEVSMWKSKIMVTSNTSADIPLNGEKLEEMTTLKYLGASIPRMLPAPLRSI